MRIPDTLKIRYYPHVARPIDLEARVVDVKERGERLLDEAFEHSGVLLVSNPIDAQVAEIFARYRKIPVSFADTGGNAIDASTFYRIFARTMREIDLMRANVDSYLDDENNGDPFEEYD